MTEKPSVTLPGTVEKIIESPHPSEPERAQIAVEGADDLYREIRIENTLTDKNGDEVRSKKGTEVDVTVEADGFISFSSMPRDRVDPCKNTKSPKPLPSMASTFARSSIKVCLLP